MSETSPKTGPRSSNNIKTSPENTSRHDLVFANAGFNWVVQKKMDGQCPISCCCRVKDTFASRLIT